MNGETRRTTIFEQWDRIESVGGPGAGWLDDAGGVHTRASYVEGRIDLNMVVDEPIYGFDRCPDGWRSVPLETGFGIVIPASLVDLACSMVPLCLDDLIEAVEVVEE